MHDLTPGDAAKDFDARLRYTLEKLRLATGVSAKTFAEMFGVSSLHYHNIRCGLEPASTTELLTLASSLNLGIDLIFSGKIDFVTLAGQFRGERRIIPAKYQGAAQQLSRVRGIYTIYKALAMNHGEGYATSVFGSFQVLPEFFESLDSFVSPLLGSDLLSEMTYRGMTPGQIRQVGAHNYFVNGDVYNRKQAQHRTPRSLYEAMLVQTPEQYDRIFSYKLQTLSDTGCTIHVAPKEEPVEVFKTRKVGTREICLFKQGVAISFLPIIQNRLAAVAESSCLYKGDSHCTYHVSW